MNRREFLGAMGLLTQRKFFLVGDDPVITVRQPYLQNVRHDRASIMWATETAGEDNYVSYSADGKNFRRANAQVRTFFPNETNLPAAFTQYTAVLPRLTPNTQYMYFAIVNGEPVGAGARFRTAGTAASGAFRFLVLGDSGMGTPAQNRVATRLGLETASFLIHVGDIAYGHGNYAEFQKNHFDVYQELMTRVPFFPAPGNHEYDTPNAAPYLALHTLPTETVAAADRGRYYSFDWGNVHFVSLDSNSDRLTNQGSLLRAMQGRSDMVNWLQRDLRSTRQFLKVVFFHHPPYAGGRNFGDAPERDVQRILCPILEANGVQVVFTGHEHNYQRTFSLKDGRTVPDGTGTVYMTLGGGGAELYPEMFMLPQTAFQRVISHYGRVDVDGSRLIVRAFNDAGVQFDSVVVSPMPVLADTNAVTFDSEPTAGSIVRVRGFNLATQESFTQNGSAAMVGTSASIGGKPVTLIYVSPTQVVGQLTEDVPANPTLSITTPNGTSDFSL